MDGSIRTLYLDANSADETAARLERREERLTVETADAVESGLDRLDGDRFGCIVSAQELADRTGIELLEAVRSRYPRLPFVLFPDDGSEALASEAISAGVTDYVPNDGDAAYERLADRIVRLAKEDRTRQFERRTQQRPEQLFERITDAFIALDPEWRVTYVNEAAEDTFGVSEALLGERLWELFPAARDTRFYEQYHEAMEERSPRSFEAYYEPWDRWYREHLYPTEDGLSVIFRDITDKKEREREREHYRERMELALEETNSLIFEVALDTGAVYRYGTLAWLFDVPSGQIETWEGFADRIVHPTDLPRFRRVFEEFEAGDRTEATLEYRTRPDVDGATWIRSELSVTDAESDPRHLIGVARDVTERKEYEHRLREERKFVKSIFESLPDPLYAFDSDGYLTRWNEELEAVTGYAEDEIDQLYVTEFVPAEEVEEIDSYFAKILDERRSVTVESAFETKAGTPIPFEFTGAPLEDADGNVRGVTGVGRDITDRKRREDRLAGLNDVLVDVMNAAEKQAVCNIAIEAARETLKLPVSTIALFDDDRGVLRPTARTPDAGRRLEERRLLREEGEAWHAFTSNDQIVLDAERYVSTDSSIDRVAVYPIGRHGIFITGLRSERSFDTELNFVETLAENLRHALDRVERETLLREHEAELEERNERLDRANRINDIIRTIDRELVAATSRADIEETVCRELTGQGPYRFAWIGRYDTRENRIEVRAQAGADGSYLDSISMSLDRDDDGENPMKEAIRMERTQVIDHVRDEPPYEPWRKEALKREFGSIIALPIVYHDRLYGVLTLYARHADLTEDLERDVLKELSANIAHAINAIEVKNALISDTIVELDLRVPVSELPLFDALDPESGYRIDLDVISPAGQGAYRVIIDADGLTSERVIDALEEVPNVREITRASAREESRRFECIVGEESSLSWLLDHGVVPRSIEVTERDGRMTVHLSPEEPVRELVELFEQRYEGAELLARRERERTERTRQTLRSELEERLTSRQREVLRLAYANGYFQSPRGRSASELAETIDITQPTFANHLREGQRKLFELLYGDELDGLDG